MSQNNRYYRQTTYEKNRENAVGSRSEYVYGNAARNLESKRRRKQAPLEVPHQEVRKNREKAHHMNAGYVLFLTAALCAAAFILVNYIQLQAELTTLTQMVASQEIVLNDLKMSNDEDYNRIINGIDLEEIKRIAMGELGMVYAQEGQIITYKKESHDYMREVMENDQ